MQDLKFLHIYGQSFWHEPAFIVGNISALESLQKAIGQVIEMIKEGKKTGIIKTGFYTNDGEGYTVFIIGDGDERDFGCRALPYTGDVARESNPSARWPWQDVLETI